MSTIQHRTWLSQSIRRASAHVCTINRLCFTGHEQTQLGQGERRDRRRRSPQYALAKGQRKRIAATHGVACYAKTYEHHGPGCWMMRDVFNLERFL